MHETKIGKRSGGGLRGAGRHPRQLLVTTPHFFLHNFWHLPACNAGSLSVVEKGESHTHRHAWRIIVILEGVEKVPSQLAVVSRGAWRVANATYVVRRIFWKSIYVT